MPAIVAVTRFKQSKSKAFTGYINYIDRSEATRKKNIEKFNMFDSYMDYMDNDEKTISIDEKKTESVSSLFTADTDKVSKEDKAALKKAFQTAQESGSNLWQTVISFENDYLQSVGIYDHESGNLNEKQLIQVARVSIEKMLLNEDMTNATWSGAIHYNTDNIHIHVAITEPFPSKEKKKYTVYEKDEKGNYRYEKTQDGRKEKIPKKDAAGNIMTYEAYPGRFKNSSHKILKSSFRKELEQNKESYIEINKLLRGIVSDKKEKELMQNDLFKEKIKELYANLKVETVFSNKSGKEIPLSVRFWNYNQNSIAHLKPKIDEISDLFIKTYHESDFKDLLLKLEAEGKEQEKFFGGRSDYTYNMLHDKYSGLYTRLGNAILKELQRYEKDKNEQIQAFKEAERGMNLTNAKNGLKRFEELSERGNSYAQNMLGFIYLKGEFVQKDLNKARAYFKKSATNGNSLGKEMLKEMKLWRNFSARNQRSTCSRDLYTAMRHLRRSLENEYMSYINKREALELQYEIEHRGEF